MPFLRRVLASLALVFGQPRRLEAKLDRILATQEIAMSKLDDIVTALDAETTAISNRLDALIAAEKEAQGEATKPETLAALQAISDRLRVLGSDPAAPIPAPAADPSSATTDPVPTAPATEPSSVG